MSTFPCQYNPRNIVRESFLKALNVPFAKETHRYTFWKNLSENKQITPFLKVWMELYPNVKENIEHVKQTKPVEVYSFLSPNETNKVIYAETSPCVKNILHELPRNPVLRQALCKNPHPSVFPIIQTMFLTYYDEDLVDILNHVTQNSNPQVLALLLEFANTLTTLEVRANFNLVRSRYGCFWWENLSKNPHLVAFFETYPEKIDWQRLSSNPSPTAIRLLEKHPDKINWVTLSYNPNAIHLLKGTTAPVCLNGLARNPRMIEVVCGLDLEKMGTQIQSFKEELQMYVLHPLRLMRISDLWNISMEDYVASIA